MKMTQFLKQKTQELVSQYRPPPRRLLTDNRPPFLSHNFAQYLQKHHIEHVISSMHYPKSNGFIESQVKMIKTALTTTQAARTPLNTLLLNLQLTPISPHMPFPREILHNRTITHPGQPSTPVNLEAVWDYLISKKSAQKHNYNEAHSIQDLPELNTLLHFVFNHICILIFFYILTHQTTILRGLSRWYAQAKIY